MLSQKIATITQEFVTGLKKVLKDKLHAVYVFGAAAFPDTLPTGDIDLHVILQEGLTQNEKVSLEQLHDSLAKKYPHLGAELDCYYLLLEDAMRQVPPKSQMWDHPTDDAWALHRKHILDGRRIVLFGPDPAEIYPPPTWSELQEALYHELSYNKKHLETYPGYCTLNLCRLIYSFKTKDVVISKSQAADWALENLPEWEDLIKLSLKIYSGQATSGDREEVLTKIKKFYNFAEKRIQQYQDEN